MRTWLVAAVLAAGCHKPEAAKPSIDVDASVSVSTLPVPSSSLPQVDAAAPVVDVARALPPRSRLVATLKGTSAHGFVAMTNGSSRVFGDVQSDISADKPVLLASFTKLWVAIAVLRAVHRGELSLDDSVATLLPDLKSKAWSDSTVRALLGHTSRVPEFDDAGGYYAKDVDFSDPVPVLAKGIGAGTEKLGVWKYRNSEFALLGAILQAKAGIPAADVLAREVFGPAGMTHAGLVVGKPPADLDLTPMRRPQNFFTAGAGYASANDLLAFFDALGAGKLLDGESQKLLFSGRPEHNHAAVGCWAFPFGGTLLVERPGSFGGVRLFSAFFPAENRAIVMWSGTSVEVGRPRTKGTLAASLAGLGLE